MHSMQLGDVNAHESDENHRKYLVVGQGKHAIDIEHEATQRVEKSSGQVSAQHDNKGWNVVASRKATATSTNSLMTSSGQKCVTNESRWANMVEEQEEHVTPHSKLSPGAPTFVPKGSSIANASSLLHRGDKELIDALGSSDVEILFANLQDEESVTTRAYTLDVTGTREPLLVPKRTLILADYKRKTDSSIQSLKIE
ncbi:hypothetical protein KY290_014405 [Solanum tuberosum]|uniref:Integrase core domain containing protein n=1 Tax=Solanum tuberosum TaxID=4113 RepID=A0ABQ7VPK4_SOLTU|nr:hypothetical protein KY289_014461 [Solanum tuberosum]KAH0770424.1 hypothetical protein KY290_014405 [Solanum tuberosum]